MEDNYNDNSTSSNRTSFTPTYIGAPHFRLPFRSVFMPVVPCVLDGCLSLLELIAKLEYIINQYHDAIEANHTDIMNLYTYVTGALDDLREYIDTQDAATLASAMAYTDSAIATLTTYINDQDAAMLVAAKAYIDEQLALKQDLLTFDQAPTDGSSNPVTSDGIYDALARKKDNYTILTLSETGGVYSVDAVFALIRLNIVRGVDYEMHYTEMSGSNVNILEFFRFQYLTTTEIIFANSRNTVTIHDDNTVTVQ